MPASSSRSLPSNAGLLQVFSVNDHDSARLVSDLLGQETVVFQTMARALDSEKSGISYSQQHTGRPLAEFKGAFDPA